MMQESCDFAKKHTKPITSQWKQAKKSLSTRCVCTTESSKPLIHRSSLVKAQQLARRFIIFFFFSFSSYSLLACFMAYSARLASQGQPFQAISCAWGGKRGGEKRKGKVSSWKCRMMNIRWECGSSERPEWMKSLANHRWWTIHMTDSTLVHEKMFVYVAEHKSQEQWGASMSIIYNTK